MWLFQALTLSLSADLLVSKGNVHSNIYVHFQESKAHVNFLRKSTILDTIDMLDSVCVKRQGGERGTK